jgi:hypothetical protein
MDIFSFFIGFLVALLFSIIIFYYIYNDATTHLKKYIIQLHEESRGVKEDLTHKTERLQQQEIEIAKLAHDISFAKEKIAFLKLTKEEIKE